MPIQDPRNDLDHLVDRFNLPPASKEAQEEKVSGPSGPVPPVHQNMEGVPPDFESQWQAYLAQSRYPEIYDNSHKACALLGYHWAVQAYKALTKKIEPLS